MQPDTFEVIRLKKLVALQEDRPIELSLNMLMQADEAAAGSRHEKRKGAGGGGTEGESAVNKLLWSLDTRLRHLEGKTPSCFLDSDDKIIVPALIQADKKYDDKHIKGSAHPMGPRRTSLAAGFLTQISKAQLDKAEGAALTYMEKCDKVAEMKKGMDMKEQQALLVYLLSTYTTAQHLEPETAACFFFKCKKPNKTSKKERHFFALRLQPHSPLVNVYPFIRMALVFANATSADGPPPASPLVRGVSKK